MKSLLLLSLCVPLIVAPVMAVNTKPSAAEDAEFVAKCAAGGGCFVVTEQGFKQAILVAFQKGHDVGVQTGYQFGQKSCKGAV